MSETHKTSQKGKDEIEIFFPDGGTINLPSIKEPIKIKKFSWGKEAILGKLLGSLLKKADLSSIRNLSGQDEQGNPQTAINLFLPLLETAPEIITKIVSVILDKDEDWVNNNLSSEDIIEVLVPFFTGAFKKYQSLITNVSQRFQKP